MRTSLIKAFIILFLFNFTYVKANTRIIYTYVNGLVCDFCARSLEKTFEKEESVKSIAIDLKDKVIIIELKKNKNLDESTIIKLVNDAGYDVEEIKYER